MVVHKSFLFNLEKELEQRVNLSEYYPEIVNTLTHLLQKEIDNSNLENE